MQWKTKKNDDKKVTTRLSVPIYILLGVTISSLKVILSLLNTLWFRLLFLMSTDRIFFCFQVSSTFKQAVSKKENLEHLGGMSEASSDGKYTVYNRFYSGIL